MRLDLESFDLSEWVYLYETPEQETTIEEIPWRLGFGIRFSLLPARSVDLPFAVTQMSPSPFSYVSRLSSEIRVLRLFQWGNL